MQIEFKDVSFSYTSDAAPALDGVSFGAEAGEFIAVIGVSGSGKSTLCRLLLGLIEQQQGEILLDGAAKPQGKLFSGVGMVFQYPEQQLFAETVFEEVSFALKCHGVPESAFKPAVYEALTDVGLDPELFCERNPFMLSGGEKRRVAIASILVMQPKILILDEPSAGVDLQGRRFITELARRKNAEGVTVIWVTHHMEEAAELADKVMVLHQGRLLLCGTAREVFNDARIDEAGLDLPPAAALMRSLRRRSAPIEAQEVRLEPVLAAIADWKLGGAARLG